MANQATRLFPRRVGLAIAEESSDGGRSPNQESLTLGDGVVIDNQVRTPRTPS